MYTKPSDVATHRQVQLLVHGRAVNSWQQLNHWHLLVLSLIWKSQDLGGNRTHDHHNSSVTALPVELPSPWEQGGGELGICIQVLFVPIIWLIHQAPPKAITRTCCQTSTVVVLHYKSTKARRGITPVLDLIYKAHPMPYHLLSSVVIGHAQFPIKVHFPCIYRLQCISQVKLLSQQKQFFANGIILW